MAGLYDILAGLTARVADLERRLQNSKRTGVVVEADPASGRYRVRLKAEGSNGKPYVTPWIPAREIAMGAIKAHVPISIGEQVTLTSESGELADAEIVGSLPSAANPRPHDKADEVVLTVGGTRLFVSGTEVEATVDGSRFSVKGEELVATVGGSSLSIKDAEVRIASAKIVLEGEVHLGGDGGELVHRKGDLDTGGDRADGAASKVYAL